MISNADIFNHFKHIDMSSRVELMCTLLKSCLPLELRLLGTYIEELASKDYACLRDFETRANSEKDTRSLDGRFDEGSRGIFITYLCLLRRNNQACSSILFTALDSMAQKLRESPPVSSSALNDYLLLLTVAIYHPAFSFHHTTTLMDHFVWLKNHAESQNQLSHRRSTSGASLCKKPYPGQLKSIVVKDCDQAGNHDLVFILEVSWKDRAKGTIRKTLEEINEFHAKLLQLYPTDGAPFDKQAKQVPSLRLKELNSHQTETMEPSLFAMKCRTVVENYFGDFSKMPAHMLKSDHVLKFLQSQPPSVNSPSSPRKSCHNLADLPRGRDGFLTEPSESLSVCTRPSRSLHNSSTAATVTVSMPNTATTGGEGHHGHAVPSGPVTDPQSGPLLRDLQAFPASDVTTASSSGSAMSMGSTSSLPAIDVWLKEVRLQKYQPNLKHLTWAQLQLMNNDDFADLGLVTGACNKIMQEISRIVDNGYCRPPSSEGHSPQRSPTTHSPRHRYKHHSGSSSYSPLVSPQGGPTPLCPQGALSPSCAQGSSDSSGSDQSSPRGRTPIVNSFPGKSNTETNWKVLGASREGVCPGGCPSPQPVEVSPRRNFIVEHPPGGTAPALLTNSTCAPAPHLPSPHHLGHMTTTLSPTSPLQGPASTGAPPTFASESGNVPMFPSSSAHTVVGEQLAGSVTRSPLSKGRPISPIKGPFSLPATSSGISLPLGPLPLSSSKAAVTSASSGSVSGVDGTTGSVLGVDMASGDVSVVGMTSDGVSGPVVDVSSSGVSGMGAGPVPAAEAPTGHSQVAPPPLPNPHMTAASAPTALLQVPNSHAVPTPSLMANPLIGFPPTPVPTAPGPAASPVPSGAGGPVSGSIPPPIEPASGSSAPVEAAPSSASSIDGQGEVSPRPAVVPLLAANTDPLAVKRLLPPQSHQSMGHSMMLRTDLVHSRGERDRGVISPPADYYSHSKPLSYSHEPSGHRRAMSLNRERASSVETLPRPSSGFAGGSRSGDPHSLKSLVGMPLLSNGIECGSLTPECPSLAQAGGTHHPTLVLSRTPDSHTPAHQCKCCHGLDASMTNGPGSYMVMSAPPAPYYRPVFPPSVGTLPTAPVTGPATAPLVSPAGGRPNSLPNGSVVPLSQPPPPHHHHHDLFYTTHPGSQGYMVAGMPYPMGLHGHPSHLQPGHLGGHQAFFSPFPMYPQPPKRGECYNCGLPGHKAVDCQEPPMEAHHFKLSYGPKSDSEGGSLGKPAPRSSVDAHTSSAKGPGH